MNALPVIQSPVSSPAEKPISLGDVDDCRFVLVTGGVISGVGKGIVASSTGVLLKSLGLRVTSIKIDPYLNIDAGTLSPFDHGEVFVLDDGGEVDLDLGNYERFLDITLTKEHNITTGKIYQQVIEKERRGDYLGKTVQVVPHVTNCIQDWILRVSRIPVDSKLVGSGEGGDSASRPQVCIIELGGTVGEIETGPFVEALRQLQFRVGRDRFLCVHVALVPETGDGEQKSKPMQHSVRDLRGLGLTPDLIACRSARPLDPTVRDKISLFCQVPPESVVAVHDCESTYHVPPLLESQGYLRFMHERLQLGQLAGPYGSLTDPARNAYWLQWQSWLAKWTDAKSSGRSVTVGVVGKYTNLPDAYISIARAIVHAGTTLGHSCRIVWIEASHLEEHADDSSPDAADNAAWKTLKACDALVIAGGFGERGTQGKIMACRHARLQMQPLLGICLGFQLSVVEWARDVLGWRDAHSTEMDPKTGHPVVVFMPEVSKTHMGGTMRLGVRRTLIDRRAGGTNASEAHAPEANESKANASKANASEAMASRIDELYGGTGYADERHRHRYEVNPSMAGQLEAAKCPQTGQQMRFVGKDDTGERMEILAIAPHPFFVGVQYHPEYKSRTLAPSPVFLGLLQAAIARKSAAQ